MFKHSTYPYPIAPWDSGTAWYIFTRCSSRNPHFHLCSNFVCRIIYSSWIDISEAFSPGNIHFQISQSSTYHPSNINLPWRLAQHTSAGQIWMPKPSFLTSLWRKSSKATQELATGARTHGSPHGKPIRHLQMSREAHKNPWTYLNMATLAFKNKAAFWGHVNIWKCTPLPSSVERALLWQPGPGRSSWQCMWHSTHTWRPLCSCPYANMCWCIYIYINTTKSIHIRSYTGSIYIYWTYALPVI